MDIKTRGIISAIIEHVFDTQNVLETIDWILKIDDDIISTEDLALGYIIGALANISHNTAIDVKKWDIIDKEHKQSLKKIYGKEEGVKKYIEEQVREEKLKESGTNYTKITLSENDIEAIRNMLIPMIARFRGKIRQEKALENI